MSTAPAEYAEHGVPVPHGEARTEAPRNTSGTIPLLLAAAFVVILNETIMAMALSRLMTDLRISPVTAQWLSAAFMLTMAVVIPITGFILQRFNSRPVFMAAMGLFSLGTLLAVVSQCFPMLLVARIVQASGTAIMLPLLMTSVLTLVPMARRGRMMGNITIVISVAPAIGPTVSGVILQWLSWRWIFGLVLPIALTMLVIGFFKMKNVSTPRRLPLDVASVILAAFGFGGLVYGLSKVGAGPNGVTMLMISLTVGVVGLVAFVLRQLLLQRRDAPLLDLRTFKQKTFSLSLGAMVISFAGLMGASILLPIYLQQVRGLPTLAAGLLMLPGGLAMGAMGPIVGRLYDQFGPRPLTIPGSLLVVVVMFGFSRITASTPLGLLLALHITLMVGFGLLFTPLFTSGLNSLPPHLYPHGSALVGTLQQVGGAAGTALLVTVMALGAAKAAATGVAKVPALTTGIQTAMFIAAILSIGTLVLVTFLGKAPAGASHPGEGSEPDVMMTDASIEGIRAV